MRMKKKAAALLGTTTSTSGRTHEANPTNHFQVVKYGQSAKRKQSTLMMRDSRGEYKWSV